MSEAQDDLDAGPATAATISYRRDRIISGAIQPTVIWLALPVLGEQLLNTLVSFVDVYLAGNLPTGSGDAVTVTAAVGLAAYVGWLASLIIMSVGAGTSAIVARAWGAGRHHAGCVTLNQSLTLAAGVGLLASGVLAVSAPAFVDFIGLDPAVRDVAVRYLRLDLIGHPAMAIAMIGGAALRGSGDMQTPLRILVAVNVINLALSIWLTHAGPGGPWGADGIVAGTVVARFAGLAIMGGYLAWQRDGLRLIARQMVPRLKYCRRILAIGGPAATDGLVMWFGHVLFLKIVGLLDDASFAAHIAGIRVESITYLSATAFGAAAATMIGQNLGAERSDRARKAGHVAAFLSGLLAAAAGACFVFFAEPIMARMNSSVEVQAVGAEALWLVGFFQIPLTMSIVYVAGLRGAGQTRLPLLATLFGTYIVRLPLSYFFAVTCGWGLFGAWLGMCFDMLVRGFLAFGMYVFSRWEDTRV